MGKRVYQAVVDNFSVSQTKVVSNKAEGHLGRIYRRGTQRILGGFTQNKRMDGDSDGSMFERKNPMNESVSVVN